MFEPLYHIIGPSDDPGTLIRADTAEEAREQFVGWVQRVAADPPAVDRFERFCEVTAEDEAAMERTAKRRAARERAAERRACRPTG